MLIMLTCVALSHLYVLDAIIYNYNLLIHIMQSYKCTVKLLAMLFKMNKEYIYTKTNKIKS